MPVIINSAETHPFLPSPSTPLAIESARADRGRFLYPRRVYILNHPEYDTETLGVEYRRDAAADPSWPKPLHYFPGDDPSRTPRNTWRFTAHIYTNWIK